MKQRYTSLAAITCASFLGSTAMSHAATTITTDGFNTGSIAETPWTGGGTVTGGQWSLNESSNTNGRLVVGNPYVAVSGLPSPHEGTGQAQFSNGNAGAGFTATLTQTVGHYFNAGDQVAINFFTAGRVGGVGALGVTVSLVGATTLTYGGTYTPTHNSNTWEAENTGYVTIVTAGTYNVRFANVAQGDDRTTYLDSVSYSVIPEPSAALLGGLGMLALLRRRRA